MNLTFKEIEYRGTDDEYILFYAQDDCNLRDYLVHDNTFDADGELSNKLRHMYRFNRTVVAKKGEYVASILRRKVIISWVLTEPRNNHVTYFIGGLM